MRGDAIAEAAGEARAHELARRRVDGELDVEAEVLPGTLLAARCVEHPFADRLDQPGVLGERDELAGRRPCRAPGRSSARAPRRRWAPGRQVVDGLVVELQLVARQRGAQARGQLEPAVRAVGVGRVHGVAAAAGALGLVHRGVGVLEQVEGVRRVTRVEADADARAHLQLGAGDRERAMELIEQLGGDRLGDGQPVAGQVVEQEHELVAALAGERVVAADPSVEPPGERAQRARRRCRGRASR